MSEKTVLRTIFEESLNTPESSFTLFGSLVTPDVTDVEKKEANKKRLASEVFLQCEEEILKRWPSNVGIKFVSSQDWNERWKERKEDLRSKSKSKYKKSLRNGTAKVAKRM